MNEEVRQLKVLRHLQNITGRLSYTRFDGCHQHNGNGTAVCLFHQMTVFRMLSS